MNLMSTLEAYIITSDWLAEIRASRPRFLGGTLRFMETWDYFKEQN